MMAMWSISYLYLVFLARAHSTWLPSGFPFNCNHIVCATTSYHIFFFLSFSDHYKTKRHANALNATRCTSPCRPSRCMFALTLRDVSASSAASRSVVHGCCKVTYGPTPARNRFDANPVENPLPTNPISVLTSRLTPT